MEWDDLDYWQSGEWQVIEEKLDDLDKEGVLYNPDRANLFAALDAIKFDRVKVAIIGQDPYPDSKYATGIAFSIPRKCKTFPPTLLNILNEYSEDLHYPFPRVGDLTPWCERGVLLWNSFPTCQSGRPASHRWLEWEYLTKEIVEKLNHTGVVFVLMGVLAQNYRKYIDDRSEVIETSHPSPLSNTKGKHPFSGSRLFTTINTKLNALGESPIDWKL